MKNRPTTIGGMFKSEINTVQSTTITDSTFKAKANKEINQDTIQYDLQYYPSDTTNLLAKLLTTRANNAEVWENADNEKWFGLFYNYMEFYIAETKIKKVKNEYSAYDSSNWGVETNNNDLCIILIAGINLLTNRKIHEPELSKNNISPGDTLKFNYLGVEYKIYAIGDKKKVLHRYTDGLWVDEIFNYRLFLTAKKNGQAITELLAALPYIPQDKSIQISFAGDLDGDIYIDLLLESYEDDYRRMILYLSKPADEGHLLKVTGIHKLHGSG